MSHRNFLALALACFLFAAIPASSFSAEKPAAPIRVVVWDEQQPRQKQAYDNFLGNAIADHLKAQPGLVVRSMNLDDGQQGLSEAVLNYAQVIVWWGHVRQKEITPETGRKIVARIKAGQLSLVVLHSAHWSTPFMEAMSERTRQIARKKFPTAGGEKVELKFVAPKRRYTAPKVDSPLTPSYYPRKYPDGRTSVTVHLPNCCFPGYRPDGKPSFLNTLLPDHPIAKDIPKKFQVAGTEMYNEPFHVPAPDQVVFEERWPTGEWFRSGAVWNIGRGKIFYFRPGHETYPVYKQKIPLQIVENAVRWMAAEQKRKK